MTRLKALRTRMMNMAALGFLMAAPVTTLSAATPPAAPDPTTPIRLTEREVDSSNAKVSMAYNELVAVWSDQFKKVGEQFATPDIRRYRGPVRTACGIMSPSNASYCPEDNTIYFDDVFVAGQAKRIGMDLGTDGDMVAVGIIAHEMGHAVAMQLGYRPRDSYANESVADCLAGAFARTAQQKGELEKGDLDEAFAGMAAAGDPTPQATGNPRVDTRVRMILARNAHGTRDQRMGNFQAGLEKGAGACLDTFQGLPQS